MAVAARHGILIRSSAFLEELADLTSLVVDKTGTLTFGTLRLQSIQTASTDRQALLNLPPASGRPAAIRSAARWRGW
jgi:P-type E1-E2 ATPase